ncbi:MAG: aldehyde dehydrogenase family protein [Myxococcota bacterium]
MTRFRSVDPSTGALVAEFPEASSREIDAGLASAAAGFRRWSALPVSERAGHLRSLARALRATRESHAHTMAEEIGKPLTQGLGEVDKCAHACDYAADHAEQWLAPETVATEARSCTVTREPLGPVLAIMPWNFPFWQLVRFGASSLAAGNPIVLKHAPNSPRCALAIAAAFAEAGFPDGVLVNLFAPVEAVPSMIADPRIAAVTLTGSTRAGRAVAEACGRSLKPSVLELGGSDPFVVLDDADLDAAARTAALARLQNNGQSCIAAKRFVVVRSVADAFVERFRHELASARTGDPRDPATTLGPMARLDLRDELHRQVTATVAAGARCALGGKVPDQPGFWYPPTLLLDPPDTSPGWTEETFGPAAVVRVVADEVEAAQVANHAQYALGAAVFTADPERAARFARGLRAGGVFVNALVRSDPRLPFGGIGDSGWGRELGRDGMWSFTATRSVWIS